MTIAPDTVSLIPPTCIRTAGTNGGATFGAGLVHVINRSYDAHGRGEKPDYGRHKENTRQGTDRRNTREDSQGAWVYGPTFLTSLQLANEPREKEDNGPQGSASAPQNQQPDVVNEPLQAGSEPQHTAFVARVQGAISDDTLFLQAELAGASIPGLRKVLDATNGEHVPEGQAVAPVAFSAPEVNASLPAEGDEPPAPASVSDPAATNPEDQPKSLNTIYVQVGNSGAEKVLVKLVQQPGELRMAVRTDNPELAHSLHQGLSDLATKLHENGFRAETWKPMQSPVEAASYAQGLSSQRHSGRDNSHSQPGSSNQHDGSPHQNRSNRPCWVEELEMSLSGGPQ